MAQRTAAAHQGEVPRGQSRKVNPTVVPLVAFIVLFSVAAVTTPLFLTAENLLNVLRQASMVAIVAVTGTALLISGSLDISIAGVLALAGVVVATLGAAGLPIFIAIPATIGVGALIGLINAFLAVRLGINWIIVTLGMLYISRGLAFVVAGGQAVVVGIPDWFEVMGRSYIGPVPTPVVIAVLVAATMAVLMRYAVLGSHIYAIGGNRRASVLAGIAVGRIQGLLFVLSGASAALAGVILASRLGSGQPEAGIGFEFDVITAIILGGTSLHGGVGSVQGTVLGVLIISVMRNIMNLNGIHAFYQLVVQGLILIGAVLLDADIRRQGPTTRLRLPARWWPRGDGAE